MLFLQLIAVSDVFAVVCGIVFFVLFTSLWLLIAIRPQWVLKQTWSPIRKDKNEKTVSYIYYRLIGSLMIVIEILMFFAFTNTMGLSDPAWSAFSLIAVAGFLLVVLRSLASALLPNSILENSSWLSGGFPQTRRRPLVIRAVGIVTLIIIGLLLWRALA